MVEVKRRGKAAEKAGYSEVSLLCSPFVSIVESSLLCEELSV